RQAEAHAVAIARHRDGMHRRDVSFFFRRDGTGDARIETEGCDNVFAVLQFEKALNRFAVPGRCRDIGDPRRIGDAKVAEEGNRRARAPGKHGHDRISFAHARRRHVFYFLLPLHPSVAGDDHDVVFLDDEIFRRVLGLTFITGNAGAARITILLLNVFDLDPDDVPTAVLVLQ